MSNVTMEQAQAMAAAQGLQIITNQDGTFSLAALSSAPVPQPTMYGQPQVPAQPVVENMHHTDGTTRGLMDAFRACGRAVNGGQDINHSL